MNQEIKDVKIGQVVKNHKHGEGMVTDKTKRTITVTYKSGLKVKNSYRSESDYFWESDF